MFELFQGWEAPAHPDNPVAQDRWGLGSASALMGEVELQQRRGGSLFRAGVLPITEPLRSPSETLQCHAPAAGAASPRCCWEGPCVTGKEPLSLPVRDFSAI